MIHLYNNNANQIFFLYVLNFVPTDKYWPIYRTKLIALATRVALFVVQRSVHPTQSSGVLLFQFKHFSFIF